MSELRARLILDAIDRVSRPIGRAQQAVQRFSRQSGLNRIIPAASNAGKAIGGVTDQVGRLAGKAALLGGIGGFLFKTQLLDVAAAFEKFETVLRTTEGSSESARKAMALVNDFAVTTPYEVSELVDSFVKLRAYGLDPTNGLLKTLGNTSAAMGKSLNQSVEAIADAVTGENERLKEFGITARTIGKRIVYEYTVNGETMRKAAKRGNRVMIEETLTAIWNEKYAGSMDNLSKTWEGMWSNLMDQVTRFKIKIMSNGVFDWLKSRLTEVLAQVDAFAASGRLDEMAATFGTKLVTALTELWSALQVAIELGQKFGSALTWLRDILGGWEPVLVLLSAVIAGPLIAALVNATIAIGSLGATLMATPVGWFLAAVALIAGAAALIYSNWGAIAEWFQQLWAGVVGTFDTFVSNIEIAGQRLKVFFLGIVGQIGQMVGSLIDMVPESLRSTIGLDGIGDALKNLETVRKGAGLDLQNMGNRQATRGVSGGEFSGLSMQKTQVGGVLRVQIESERPVRVQELRSDNPNVPVEVDTGLVMAQ